MTKVSVTMDGRMIGPPQLLQLGKGLVHTQSLKVCDTRSAIVLVEQPSHHDALLAAFYSSSESVVIKSQYT
jgi:hypothetical protein